MDNLPSYDDVVKNSDKYKIIQTVTINSPPNVSVVNVAHAVIINFPPKLIYSK
jgi:hypothetical protein